MRSSLHINGGGKFYVYKLTQIPSVKDVLEVACFACTTDCGYHLHCKAFTDSSCASKARVSLP